MSETTTILCGSCRVPVVCEEHSDGAETARCPDCGETAPLQEAVDIASEYKIDQLAGKMFSGLGKTSSSLTIIKVGPKKNYRFITAD